jgi:hypothetical protein
MTTHSDQHITDAEDAAVDRILKIVGMVIVLAIAGVALTYIYS